MSFIDAATIFITNTATTTQRLERWKQIRLLANTLGWMFDAPENFRLWNRVYPIGDDRIEPANMFVDGPEDDQVNWASGRFTYNIESFGGKKRWVTQGIIKEEELPTSTGDAADSDDVEVSADHNSSTSPGKLGNSI